VFGLLSLLDDHNLCNIINIFYAGQVNETRLEKCLLIIRNLQSEKTIVDKQEEFYLSKESFLLERKKIPADKEIFPLQKETFF
jgi:hypothetical protein